MYKLIYINKKTIMSFLTTITNFISKIWKSLTGSTDTAAIAITEGIQEALKNGTLTTITKIVEAVLPIGETLPAAIIAKLDVLIPQILSFELSIQGLSDNPTEVQIKAFEDEIIKAFGVSTDNSKLWTTLAAQVYIIIKSDVESGTKYTFAQAVIDVEKAYHAYVADTK
jgi:hypothetical protein